MAKIFDLRKRIEQYTLAVLLFTTCIYGIWRIYPLIAGPHIAITTPVDGQIVPRTTFVLSGHVSRVKKIELQGRPIHIDTVGNFSEVLSAQEPYTLVILTATDFYGKTITKSIRVIPK